MDMIFLISAITFTLGWTFGLIRRILKLGLKMTTNEDLVGLWERMVGFKV